MKKKDNTNSVVKALRPFGQALYKARRAARKQRWKEASDLYLQASVACKTRGTIKLALERESARLASLAENPPTFRPLTEEKIGRYVHGRKIFYSRGERTTDPYRPFYEEMGEL